MYRLRGVHEAGFSLGLGREGDAQSAGKGMENGNGDNYWQQSDTLPLSDKIWLIFKMRL